MQLGRATKTRREARMKEGKGGRKSKVAMRKSGSIGKDKGKTHAKDMAKRKKGGGDDKGKGDTGGKRKHNGRSVGGAKRCSPDNEEEAGRKRKKRRVEGAPVAAPKPRPRPTPAWKGSAALSARDDSTPSAADAPTPTDFATGGRGDKVNTVRGVKGRKGPPGWRPAMD